jgi:hypothetical protein
VGWAHALDTPYQWTKQIASHWGGTRNGTIVHWPKGIEARGEVRSQFHHVIDVAPTVLQAAGLPQPTFVNGVQQHPIEGVSMVYSFNDADAEERHEMQYFEVLGNRGIYHKGMRPRNSTTNSPDYSATRFAPSGRCLQAIDTYLWITEARAASSIWLRLALCWARPIDSNNRQYSQLLTTLEAKKLCEIRRQES